MEQLKARDLPGLQPAVELTNVGVPQRHQAIRSHGDEALARVVDNDRHILAGQSRLRLERDPPGRHVGGKQGMAGGKGSLVPHIEQRDFLAQQQREANLRGGDGRHGHGKAGLDEGELFTPWHEWRAIQNKTANSYMIEIPRTLATAQLAGSISVLRDQTAYPRQKFCGLDAKSAVGHSILNADL